MGSFHELPPEIEHITFGYEPLHKLVKRLVQESFNDLTQVIDDMAIMPAQQASSKSSTYGNHNSMTNGDRGAPANTQKKMRLMNFVQSRRAQFIKVLVLAQWSREATNVGKVIDLKVWLDGQRQLYEEAGWWLGDLKRTLEPAKVPNPDIKTALEVLSTGKASWIPELGYITPQPLTSKEILKTLRSINTLLAIRLNLHETLPHHFSRFTIADGRATFRVPEEFEVDISIGDEDPSSQLYFIDFRFLFLPIRPEIPTDRLKTDLERETNKILEKDGLQGCYDFLHEFVLTHKISILRRQAGELSRGRWTESIKLETVRRTLVVQYWLNRAGGKSWIEIGIKSGRNDPKLSMKERATSKIGVKWVRDGKEVRDASINLSLEDLSMEAILKKVIALHTNHILFSIRTGLGGIPLYARRTLSLSASTSATEPANSLLRVQLTSSRTATLSIEPITGRFCLQPASLLFTRVENDINYLKDPTSDAHYRIASLRCHAAAEEIESRARCVGWELSKSISPKQEDAKRVFPPDTLRTLYLRRKGWSREWIVGVGIGSNGESWWIIETMPTATGFSFGDFQRLPIATTATKPIDPTYDFLSRLERTAAAMVCHFVNVRSLNKLHVHHALRSASTTFENAVRIPILLIRFSSLLSFQGRDRGSKFWAKDLLKVTYKGITSESGQATMITEARLVLPMPPVVMVKDRIDDDVAFSPATGAFAFLLHTPVGEPIIETLKERLRRIERLVRFLDVVRRFKLKCETVSLGRIVFLYSAEHNLKADISFVGDAPVTFSLSKNNPHLRIQDFLARLLNTDTNGLESVTLLLGITLPLLLSLTIIERRTSETSPATAVVLPRTADWYQLRYDSPPCIFDIRLRRRRDEVKWHVCEDGIIPPDRDPRLVEGLARLMNSSGEGWLGLRTGIAAGVDGVRDVLEKMDDVVRNTGVASKPGDNTKGSGQEVKAKGIGDVVEID
ncbi:MAG: mediator complex subunit [Sclerophora amabilis]|nr:MAG: mediator complex subunit [Sclerophora amabilis]